MSMKKKSVSLAEKKTRMLDLFYESKEFFTLKDLEKIAPKEKGITANTVKDVLQVLVDEGLVDTDKIGTNVFFWAFPSKHRHTQQQKYEALQRKLNDLNERLSSELEPKYAALNSSSGDEEYVASMLNTIEELKKEKTALEKEVKESASADPERVEKMRSETKVGFGAFQRRNSGN
jgi:Fe2+ or Zn2+ uptake regulation protein